MLGCRISTHHSAELKLPSIPAVSKNHLTISGMLCCLGCAILFFVWIFFLIIIHCAGHKALTSKAFFSTGTDLPGLWHRASCWAGTDWVHFQLTSIYLPVITSSWLFALALHLQIAPVLSKGLTDAGILDSISNFKHQFDCVSQPRHLHTLPLFDLYLD